MRDPDAMVHGHKASEGPHVFECFSVQNDRGKINARNLAFILDILFYIFFVGRFVFVESFHEIIKSHFSQSLQTTLNWFQYASKIVL